MGTDIRLEVGGDASRLRREIERVLKKRYSIAPLDSRGFSQPLGKIRGELGEFQKSLEASNARVLAFGASAGAIYMIGDALKQSVKHAIAVEKSLAEINVVLNLTTKQLEKFGTKLFDIAGKTGQSFQAVAVAATELSRQGLGVTNTLKRLNDAMMLARLGGMSTVGAVESLTAALNSFNRTAITSNELVNKMAAVDAAFAVSSRDLAEAIKRVASTASTAGVSIDELMAIVTSAQQTTARGGNVIGNSFKTIFTRIQRPRVLENLRALGVAVTDAAGASLPLMKIMQNLAKTFDTLGDAQQAQIAELVGGVFQINILKATMSDLGKQNSVYAQALRVSANAANEANDRNKQLNETLSAKLNRTLQNLTKTAAGVGKLTFGPLISNVADGLNGLMDAEGKVEGIGTKLGKGLLSGIGQFLAGPGVMIITATLVKIFGKLAMFTKDAFAGISGIQTASQKRAALEKQIAEYLGREPALIEAVRAGVMDVNEVHDMIIAKQRNELSLMRNQKNMAVEIARAMASGSPMSATTAKGHVPRYQKDAEQREASAAGAGQVASFQGPGTIGGKPFTMNSKEAALNVPWSKDTAVVPTYGSVGDKATKELAEGFANYAKGAVPKVAKSSPLAEQWIKAVRGGEDVGATMGLGRGGTESRSTMPQMGDAAQKLFEKDLQAGTGMAGQLTGGKKVGIQFGGSAKVANLKATQKDIYGSNVLSKLEGAFGPTTWDKAGPTTMPGWLTNPVMTSQGNKILDGHHRWATVYARDAIDDGKIGGLSMQTNKIGLPIQQLLQLAESYSGAKAAGGETTVPKIGGKKKKKAGGHIPRFQMDPAERKRLDALKIRGTKIGGEQTKGGKRIQEAKGTLKDTDIGGAAMIVPQFDPSVADGRANFKEGGINVSFPIYGPQDEDMQAALSGHVKTGVGEVKDKVADMGNKMGASMAKKAPGKGLVKQAMSGIEGIPGATASVVGGAFEAGVQTALQKDIKGEKGLQTGANFDLRAGGIQQGVKEIFGVKTETQGDIKNSTSSDNQRSFANKIISQAQFKKAGLFAKGAMGPGGVGHVSDLQAEGEAFDKKRAQAFPKGKGYIPRFQGDLANVMDDEIRGLVNSEGMSATDARKSVYAATDPRIKDNSMGMGVFNNLHEPKGPGGMSNGAMRNGKGRGHIPRYQVETMGGVGFGMIAGLGSQIAMLGAITNKAGKELGVAEEKLQDMQDALAAVESASGDYQAALDKEKATKRTLEKAQAKEGLAIGAVTKKEKQIADAPGMGKTADEIEELENELTLLNLAMEDAVGDVTLLGDASAKASADVTKAGKRKQDARAKGVDVGIGDAGAGSAGEAGAAEAIDAQKKKNEALANSVAKEQKMQGHLQTASMVLPMMSGVIQSIAGEGSNTAEAMKGVTQGAQIAMMAMMTIKGPAGMIVGAIIGVFVAAVNLAHTFSDVHQTAKATKKRFEQVNASNTRLVESLDNYTSAADKLSAANSDLSVSSATVLRLQKNQAVALSNITDAGTRMAVMMAADADARADAIANAKATANAETARAKSASEMAKVAEDQAGGWEKWSFGLIQNDEWELDGDLGDALDHFGSLAKVAAVNAKEMNVALGLSAEEFLQVQIAAAQIAGIGKRIIQAMDPDKFKEFEEGMRNIGPLAGIAGKNAEDSIQAMLAAGVISADQAAAFLIYDDDEMAAVVAGLKEQVVAAGQAAAAEKALEGARMHQKAVSAALKDAVDFANSALEAAIDNFYNTAQHISLMARSADELREKVGYANREIKMAFQKETLKTAGPRISRKDKETGEFAIKKAEFQQKAIKQGKETNRLTKGDIAKPLAAGLKNAMSKIKADPKTGKIDAVGLEKQRKIQEAQLELSKLEARRESLTPAQYAAEMTALTKKADISILIPNIASMHSDIKRALDKGNIQRAKELVEMSKQKIIMENARREQLKRLQADKDSTKMGGIKAFLDPKSMKQTWTELATETGKLVQGGSKIEQGRSAMKVAMSLKDLTGAQSMGELGGLGEMAIEGRGADIKQQSLAMAKMLKTKAAMTGDPRVRAALLSGAAKAEQNAGRATAIAKEQVDRTLQLEKAPLEMVRLLGSINSVLGGQAAEIATTVAQGAAAYSGVMAAGAQGAAFAAGGAAPPAMVAAQNEINMQQANVDQAHTDSKNFVKIREAINVIQARRQKESTAAGTGLAGHAWQQDAQQAFDAIKDQVARTKAEALNTRGGTRAVNTEAIKRADELLALAKDFYKRTGSGAVPYNMQGPAGAQTFTPGGIPGMTVAGGGGGGGGGNINTMIAEGQSAAIANTDPPFSFPLLAAVSPLAQMVFGSAQHVYIENPEDISNSINGQLTMGQQVSQGQAGVGGIAAAMGSGQADMSGVAQSMSSSISNTTPPWVKAALPMWRLGPAAFGPLAQMVFGSAQHVVIDNPKDIYQEINRTVKSNWKERAGGAVKSAAVYGGGGTAMVKIFQNQAKIGQFAGNVLSRHLPSMANSMNSAATRFPTMTKYLSNIPGLSKVTGGVLDSVKLAEKGPGLTAKLMSKSSTFKSIVQGFRQTSAMGGSFGQGAGAATRLGGKVGQMSKAVANGMSKVTNSSAFTKVFGATRTIAKGNMPANLAGNVVNAGKGGATFRQGGLLGKGGKVSDIVRAFKQGMSAPNVAIKTGRMATSAGRAANAAGRGINTASTWAKGSKAGQMVKGLGGILKPITGAIKGGFKAGQAGSAIATTAKGFGQAATVGARAGGAGGFVAKGASLAAKAASGLGATLGRVTGPVIKATKTFLGMGKAASTVATTAATATKTVGIMGKLGPIMGKLGPPAMIAAAAIETYQLATDYRGTVDAHKELLASGKFLGFELGALGTGLQGFFSPIKTLATSFDIFKDTASMITGIGDFGGVEKHMEMIAGVEEGRAANREMVALESAQIASGQIEIAPLVDELLGTIDVGQAFRDAGGNEIFATGGINEQQKIANMQFGGKKGSTGGLGIEEHMKSLKALPTSVRAGLQQLVDAGSLVGGGGAGGHGKLSMKNVEWLLKNNLPDLKKAMQATRKQLGEKRKAIVEEVGAKVGLTKEQVALGAGSSTATELIKDMGTLLKVKSAEKNKKFNDEMLKEIKAVNALKAKGMGASGMTQIQMDTPSELIAINKLLANLPPELSKEVTKKALEKRRAEMVAKVNASKGGSPEKTQDLLRKAAQARGMAQEYRGTEEGHRYAQQARELNDMAAQSHRQSGQRFDESGKLMTQDQMDAQDKAEIVKDMTASSEFAKTSGGAGMTSDEIQSSATIEMARRKQLRAMMGQQISRGQAGVGAVAGGGGTMQIDPATGRPAPGGRFISGDTPNAQVDARRGAVASAAEQRMTMEGNAQATRQAMLVQLNNAILQNIVMIKSGNERWAVLNEKLCRIMDAAEAQSGTGGGGGGKDRIVRHSGKIDVGALQINATGLPVGIDEALKQKFIQAINDLEIQVRDMGQGREAGKTSFEQAQVGGSALRGVGQVANK